MKYVIYRTNWLGEVTFRSYWNPSKRCFGARHEAGLYTRQLGEQVINNIHDISEKERFSYLQLEAVE